MSAAPKFPKSLILYTINIVFGRSFASSNMPLLGTSILNFKCLIILFSAFEASSIRSVSMGTLNEIYDTPLYNQRGKRTVSVEHLYDHPGRPFFEKSLPPPLSNEEVYPDLVSRSLSKPSQEEERLERIEKKLRQLQKQLKEVSYILFCQSLSIQS